MKTLTQALANASAVIEKTVQSTVQDDQIGSAKSRDGHAPYAFGWLDESKNRCLRRQPMMVPKELKGMEMGILEIKHGLLQIAETLDFLHNNARLIHRAISPQAVMYQYMLFINDVLRKIEEKRGVTLTQSGQLEPKPSPKAEGILSGKMNIPVPTAPSDTRRHSAWDEDWIPIRGTATAPQSSSSTPAAQPAVSNQSAQSSLSLKSSAPSIQQPPSSCSAIGVEWHPKNSSNAADQFGGLDILNGNKSISDTNLDDIDPFANWPPRPSGIANDSCSMSNGSTPSSMNKYGFSSSSTSTSGLNSQSSSWAFSTQTQNQGINSYSGSSNGGLSSPLHIWIRYLLLTRMSTLH